MFNPIIKNRALYKRTTHYNCENTDSYAETARKLRKILVTEIAYANKPEIIPANKSKVQREYFISSLIGTYLLYNPKKFKTRLKPF